MLPPPKPMSQTVATACRRAAAVAFPAGAGFGFAAATVSAARAGGIHVLERGAAVRPAARTAATGRRATLRRRRAGARCLPDMIVWGPFSVSGDGGLRGRFRLGGGQG